MAMMTEMASAVMVRHVKVLRLGVLARVSDGTTVVRASRISGGLELLLNSSVLVNSVVVQVMTVAATGGCVISLVSSAAY